MVPKYQVFGHMCKMSRLVRVGPHHWLTAGKPWSFVPAEVRGVSVARVRHLTW